ncbi:hypothetical protein PYCCODRAFT_1472863 [Trametes coccinea BRFM310]|uniref:Uncharacterized protein n=1 Tax=Trametes coccinea (strain BRFM310) TaxID=1353009 RepID=A0A1Y2I669_TRAC3|nr:hypothetical protein PYCCODRAFT_1472863 [Trametes coccinea BRFM310]
MPIDEAISDSTKRDFRESSPLSDVPSSGVEESEDNAPPSKKPRTDNTSPSGKRKAPRKAVDQAGTLGIRTAGRHAGLSSLPPGGGSSKGSKKPRSSAASASGVDSDKFTKSKKAETRPRSRRDK